MADNRWWAAPGHGPGRPARVRIALVLAVAMAVALVVPGSAEAAPGAPTFASYPVADAPSTTAAFSFFVPGGMDGYDCRLDQGTWQSCSGGAAGTHVVSGLADGAHRLEVRGVQAGEAGEIGSLDWTVTAAPTVDWIHRPSGVVAGASVAGSFRAAGASGYQCSVDAGSFVGCGGSSPSGGFHVMRDLAEGAHTLRVRALDGSAVGPVAEASFTVARPLSVVWDDEPSGVVAGASVAGSFRAAGASGYQCSVDAGSFVGCGGSSPSGGFHVMRDLAEGAHTLRVRALDGSAVGPVAEASFTVARPLSVVWDDEPSGVVAGASVAGSFRAAGASGYQCSVDAGSFVGCGGSSPSGGFHVMRDLAEGAHTLRVRALDGSAVGPVAEASFTVARPLSVVWDDEPSGVVAGASVAGSFRAAGASGYQCSVDAGSFVGCGGSSPSGGFHVMRDLAEGAHTLRVRALDGSAVGPVAEATFTVASPPAGPGLDVTPTSGPAAGASVPSGAVGFSWVAPGAACYRYSLDDPDVAVNGCSSAFDAAGFSGLADGLHTLRIQAVSDGGSPGPVLVRSFTVVAGSSAAVGLRSGPAAGASVPSGAVGFSWVAPGAACYRYSLDDPDVAVNGCSSAFDAAGFSGLADGLHTLRIQAVSDGGSPGPVLVRSFTVVAGSSAAVGLRSGPAAGASVPSGAVGFSWVAPGAACYRYSLDDPDVAVNGCSSAFDAAGFSGLADGLHTLRIQAVSDGGSPGPVTSRPFTITAGLRAEVGVLSGPAEGAVVTTTSPAYSWAAPGAACYRYSLDDPDVAVNGCSSAFDAAGFSDLADGTHTLRIQAQTSGGTLGPVLARTFTVTAAPAVVVVSAPRMVLPVGVAAFSWVAPGAACYRYSLDDPDVAVNGCSSAFDQATFTGLGAGAHTFRAQAQSTGGAFGPVATVVFEVGAGTVPDTTITAAPDAVSNVAEPVFSFSSDDAAATFECRVDAAGQFVPCRVAGDAQRLRRRRPRIRGPRGRRRRPRPHAGRARVDDRHHRAADRGHRPAGAGVGGGLGVRVQLRRPDGRVRVPGRRRDPGAVHLALDARRPDRRRADRRATGAGRRRERVGVGRPRVDGRRHPTGRGDHGRPGGRLDRRHRRRVVPVHDRRRGRRGRLPHRRRSVRPVHVAACAHRARRGPAHVRGPGHGRGRQPRLRPRALHRRHVRRHDHDVDHLVLVHLVDVDHLVLVHLVHVELLHVVDHLVHELHDAADIDERPPVHVDHVLHHVVDDRAHVHVVVHDAHHDVDHDPAASPSAAPASAAPASPSPSASAASAGRAG